MTRTIARACPAVKGLRRDIDAVRAAVLSSDLESAGRVAKW